MTVPARLVLPALRWKVESGFEHESDTIARGLEAGVGGFIVFGGVADAVAQLTSDLGRRAGRPLLIGSDLERGAGQQVAGLPELPPPAALGSLGDLELIRQAGAVTGRTARSVGINWVYAPDADLDVIPENPIVQTRSFGSDPTWVGRAAAAWIDGCQSAGAAACAKHFPGHGRTRIDPHDRLPVVDDSVAVIDQSDLMPFRAAISARVASIMTGHIVFPALDPERRPATLSPTILGMLRRELGFEGAVVSDAMMMGAIREGRDAGATGVDAVRAGVDLLLYPNDPWQTIAALGSEVAASSAFAARVDRADASYRALLVAASKPPLAAQPADLEFADRVADRLVEANSLSEVRLRQPIQLVVVDDDRDGAYPASPNDFLEQALARAGIRFGPGGSRVVAVFAEPRASKGRAGLGTRSLEELAAQADATDLVVLFAHPRLRSQLPGGRSVLVAWHRQRLMQEAVGRWIRSRLD